MSTRFDRTSPSVQVYFRTKFGNTSLSAQCIYPQNHILKFFIRSFVSWNLFPLFPILFNLTFWLSPRPISNSQLRALLHFHLCPIYLVVFKGSYSCDGISHLEGGFTLRCLQRLSLPDLATLLCRWHDNRYTSGPSIPVLSY